MRFQEKIYKKVCKVIPNVEDVDINISTSKTRQYLKVTVWTAGTILLTSISILNIKNKKYSELIDKVTRDLLEDYTKRCNYETSKSSS